MAKKTTHRVVKYHPERSSWESIQGSIMRIERAAFGTRAYARTLLQEAFTNLRNVIVVVQSQKGRIAGYAYAQLGSKYNSKKRSVAYLESIALLPSLRGKKLGGKMISKLEQDLRKQGVRTLELDAKVCNGFAKRIEEYNRSHGRPVLKSYTHNSPWGKQKFLRFHINCG